MTSNRRPSDCCWSVCGLDTGRSGELRWPLLALEQFLLVLARSMMTKMVPFAFYGWLWHTSEVFLLSVCSQFGRCQRRKNEGFWWEREREREKPKLAEKVPRKDNKTIKQIDSCRTKDWGKKSLRLRLVKLRTVKERTLTVGGSVAEWLISCLESTASIHTKNNIFSFLSNPILVNWRPAIQRYFPKQWVFSGTIKWVVYRYNVRQIIFE